MVDILWTEHDPDGEGSIFEHIAINADGTKCIVCGGTNWWEGRIWTYDGNSWTEQRPAGDVDRYWTCCDISADGTKFIATCYAGSGGEGRVYTYNGSSWTEQQPAGNKDRLWQACAISADGTKFLVGSDDDDLYSYDGSWHSHNTGDGVGAWRAVDISSDGAKFIASSHGGRLWTYSGSWVERRPCGDTNQYWQGVGISDDGTKFIAGIYNTDSNGRLWTYDGSSWTEQRPAGDVGRNWHGARINSDGTLFVATASYGGATNATYFFDGTSWSEISQNASPIYCDMSANGSKFAEMGGDGVFIGRRYQTVTSPAVAIALLAVTPAWGVSGYRMPALGISLSLPSPSKGGNSPVVGDHFTFKGHIDDLAISRGGTYETESFTVPDGPYTSSGAVPIKALVLALGGPAIGTGLQAPVIGITVAAGVPDYQVGFGYDAPIVALSVSLPSPDYEIQAAFRLPAVSLSVAATAPTWGYGYDPPAVGLLVEMCIPSYGPRTIPMDTWIALGLTLPVPSYVKPTFSAAELALFARRYYFTLTGDADGLDDIEIPISRFEARDTLSDQAYMRVEIPDYETWIDAVTSRPNGEMVIEGAYLSGGVEMARAVILRGDLEDIDYHRDHGGSITLTGHRDSTYSLDRLITSLDGVSYLGLSGGKRRIRALPNFDVWPSDVVQMPDDTYMRVGNVVWSVSEQQQTMELTEADEDLNTEYALAVNTNQGIS